MGSEAADDAAGGGCAVPMLPAATAREDSAQPNPNLFTSPERGMMLRLQAGRRAGALAAAAAPWAGAAAPAAQLLARSLHASTGWAGREEGERGQGVPGGGAGGGGASAVTGAVATAGGAPWDAHRWFRWSAAALLVLHICRQPWHILACCRVGGKRWVPSCACTTCSPRHHSLPVARSLSLCWALLPSRQRPGGPET